MKKGRLIILFFVALFAIIIAFQYNKDEKSVVSKDAIKFKEEYEKLNDKVNPNNNKNYPVIEINDDNPIKYSNYDEIFEILKSGTGVIYLGYPESALSRNLVPTLLQATYEVEINTIYYLNIKDDMEVLYLDENNNILTANKGSKNYNKLLVQLDEMLDEYVLVNSYGDKVNTGKKKIEIPSVVFVVDGKIVGYHVGTVSSHEDPYYLLDERQKEELLLKLINLCSIVKGNVCDERC